MGLLLVLLAKLVAEVLELHLVASHLVAELQRTTGILAFNVYSSNMLAEYWFQIYLHWVEFVVVGLHQPRLDRHFAVECVVHLRSHP